MGRFCLLLCKSPAQVSRYTEQTPNFIKEMTELETLFIRNNRQLRNDIAAAVEAEEISALSKYQAELDYEVQYSASISCRATTHGTISLNSKEEAQALVDGEYDLEENFHEVEQHETDNECWDYECDEYEVRIYNLELRNPSPEAAQLIEEERVERDLVLYLRDVLDGAGIKKSWRNCPQKAFIQEHAKELVKALASQN